MSSKLTEVQDEQGTNTRGNGLQRSAGVADALIHDIDANANKSETMNNVWS